MVLIDETADTWAFSVSISRETTTNTIWLASGAVTLSGDLDRVRIRTSGTGSFGAGTVNILYEG